MKSSSSPPERGRRSARHTPSRAKRLRSEESEPTASSTKRQRTEERQTPTPSFIHNSNPENGPAFLFNDAYQPPPSDLYSYEHCPLPKSDDIRILTIRPGQGRDSLECYLNARPLTALDSPGTRADPYEALSYYWGSGDPIEKIRIHVEHTFPAKFWIRENLHSALTHLRYTDRPRTLWIDAICINQNDNEEKNSQVSRMSRIYAGADNVCVWLGDETGDSNIAMEFVSRVVNLDDFDRLIVDDKSRAEWAAMSNLMRRDWFNRRWVVQEIALAKRATVYCGEKDVDWADFADAVSLFEAVEIESNAINKKFNNPEWSNHMSTFLGEIKFLGATRLVDATSNLFRKGTRGEVLEHLLTLEALVSNLSAFKASRAHDVVYAVLALAKGVIGITAAAKDSRQPQHEIEDTEEGRRDRKKLSLMKSGLEAFRRPVVKKEFIINYETPFFEVCKEFLMFAIKTEQSLDIICRPWVPEDSIEEQVKPSWLLTTKQAAYGLRPDGNFDRAHADTLVGPAGLGKRNYSASGPFKVAPAWKLFGTGAKERFMYVEGFVIDTVGAKKAYAADGIILHEWLEAGDWSDMSALPPPPLWRTLCADRGPNGSNPPTFYPRACKSALNQSVKHGHISTERIVHRGKSTVVARFLKRVQEVIWMRRLIKTKGGQGENDLPRLGLAPQLTKKRDLICILYGCSVPVVLRKHCAGESDEHYSFIGECYVHGIMEGEAFDLISVGTEARRSRSKPSSFDRISLAISTF